MIILTSSKGTNVTNPPDFELPDLDENLAPSQPSLVIASQGLAGPSALPQSGSGGPTRRTEESSIDIRDVAKEIEGYLVLDEINSLLLKKAQKRNVYELQKRYFGRKLSNAHGPLRQTYHSMSKL